MPIQTLQDHPTPAELEQLAKELLEQHKPWSVETARKKGGSKRMQRYRNTYKRNYNGDPDKSLADNGWRFVWGTAKKRFGCCKYDERVIEVSRPLLKIAKAGVTENTLRHEVAHAIAGYLSAHGTAWKQACKLTGAIPKACASISDIADDETSPLVYACCGCGETYGPRHKTPPRNGEIFRTQCCGGYKGVVVPRRHIAAWQAGDAIGALPKPYAHRNGASLATAAHTSTSPAPVKKQRTIGGSNKMQVYTAWKAGERDVDTLCELVHGAVKATTVKGWMGSWKRGNNLPKR